MGSAVIRSRLGLVQEPRLVSAHLERSRVNQAGTSNRSPPKFPRFDAAHRRQPATSIKMPHFIRRGLNKLARNLQAMLTMG